MHSYRIETRKYRAVGWAALLSFTLASLVAFAANEMYAGVGLGFFALVGLYVLLGAGSFEISGTKLRHISAFGQWEISWAEIVAAEIGASDGTLVFYGANKRFVLSPPAWWGGPERDAALRWVITQLDEHQIPTRSSRTAAYKIMWNTRVRRPGA
jgi:hypothetical protein